MTATAGSPYAAPYIEALAQASADNFTLARLMSQLLNSPRTRLQQRWDTKGGYTTDPTEHLELHIHAAVNLNETEAATIRRLLARKS